MRFSVLLAALLVEYFRPLPSRFRVYGWFSAYAGLLERHFNAGEHRHGLLAWLLGVGPLAGLVVATGLALAAASPLLEWFWSVAVLYLVMGLKQFNDNASRIASMLRNQELDEARSQLGRWTGRDTAAYSPPEVARLAIDETLAGAYRQLFGVMLWFAILGTGGAVLYRLAQILGQKWGILERREFGVFGVFAARAQGVMEWLPLRVTALSFAVVGDFEDAMYCWRSQADQWAQSGIGIVLASGAGALGVKLGEPLPGTRGESRPELGIGDEADGDYLDSALSLTWRALMLWLAALLLVALARWTSS